MDSPLSSLPLWLLLALVLVNSGVLLWLAARKPEGQDPQQQEDAQRGLLAAIATNTQNLERALRQEIA